MSSTASALRPDVASFLADFQRTAAPALAGADIAAARQAMKRLCERSDLPVGDLAVLRDLTIPGPAGAIPARLFDVVEVRPPGPVVLFFHGGGFAMCDLDTHASFCAEMSRTLDMPVLAATYRLVPEHAFPAAPEDALAAARWLAGRPGDLGRDPTSVVLCGDSAGGNLAIVVAQAMRRDPGPVRVIAHGVLYPATDMRTDHPSMDEFASGGFVTRENAAHIFEVYGGGSDPRASPLHTDLTGMPPAVVMTAGYDPLRDQGRAYAAALARAGVAVTFREAVGNSHGFVTFRRATPSSQGDVAEFLAALRAIISADAGSQLPWN